MIHILDNALPDIEQYRADALSLEYRSYDFGHCVFHGIAVGEPTKGMLDRVARSFPDLTPTLTFFRKSPENQEEPHFIHTDVDMGHWSAILYLNPDPPHCDGTAFWTHRETGAIGSAVPHERSEEGRRPDGWEMRMLVPARFNRLVLFPSFYFHSRSIYKNWTKGGDMRLTQVAFGTGELVKGVL